MKNYRREYDLETIGRNLRRLRKAKNLTVDEVREYLRLGSVQAVYKYERGLSYPQADTMFALMELYEANLYDIIGNPEGAADMEEDEKSSSSVICAGLRKDICRLSAA
ncbi:MAG: helix-turn-helix transcriptional regulator [Lachnospiraceae bacterium]|nr:helix-turn-helix transcriptional regulator [Lachnospiraceae bacterium]